MTERTGQAHEAGTIDRLMAGWVADVETPDACAAHLLCDRWPADAVAFRFVAEDMSAVDLPFGELADTCGTFGDPDGVEAAFTTVPGVPDAAHIALGNSGMDTALFTMTVGGVTDGDELVYLGMVGLDEEIAAETLRAQVEAFEARER